MSTQYGRLCMMRDKARPITPESTVDVYACDLDAVLTDYSRMISELTRLRAENGRLRSLLDMARDYVSSEIETLKAQFAGYERLGRIAETEQDLAAIDAAMGGKENKE